MVWTTKAKRNFYWTRRKKATESFVQAAGLLGTSVKVARKKASKATSRALAGRKEGYKEINKIDRQLIRLQKQALTKGFNARTDRKIQRLTKKQNAMIVKVNEKWQKFEHDIGFKPIGDEDERSKRDTP